METTKSTTENARPFLQPSVGLDRDLVVDSRFANVKAARRGRRVWHFEKAALHGDVVKIHDFGPIFGSRELTTVIYERFAPIQMLAG